jgi:hypothetical protein
MPDFDFDAFNHDEAFAADNYGTSPALNEAEAPVENVAEVALQVEQKTNIAEPEQDIDISSITEKKPLEARDSSASKGDNLSGEEVDKW